MNEATAQAIAEQAAETIRLDVSAAVSMQEGYDGALGHDSEDVIGERIYVALLHNTDVDEIAESIYEYVNEQLEAEVGPHATLGDIDGITAIQQRIELAIESHTEQHDKNEATA